MAWNHYFKIKNSILSLFHVYTAIVAASNTTTAVLAMRAAITELTFLVQICSKWIFPKRFITKSRNDNTISLLDLLEIDLISRYT